MGCDVGYGVDNTEVVDTNLTCSNGTWDRTPTCDSNILSLPLLTGAMEDG